MACSLFLVVIPAQAGVQLVSFLRVFASSRDLKRSWIPAFAGMTEMNVRTS